MGRLSAWYRIQCLATGPSNGANLIFQDGRAFESFYVAEHRQYGDEAREGRGYFE